MPPVEDGGTVKNPARFVCPVLFLCLCFAAKAQVTSTNMSTADAFLATGSANNPEGADLTGLNFGGAGTLAISPASSFKGEFQSVIKFNLSNSVALFNASYGVSNWSILGISLQLTSNYGVAGVQPNNPIFNTINGGDFVIEWLSNNDWVEGTGNPRLPTTDGVTYNSIPSLETGLHVALCTNTYSPPGNNVTVTWSLPLDTNLVADAASGGDVSFLFHAADDQVNYLFNSYNYGRGNEPLILVTAASIPAPLELLSGQFTNSLFRLTGIGGPNSQYQVQANSDLAAAQWRTIGTATADSAGRIQFDDITAANQPRRFYRLAK